MSSQSPNYEDAAGLKYDRPSDRVLRITMSRGSMNTFNYEMHHALAEIWPVIDNDSSVNAVIVTGAGEVFSAGGDFGLVEKVVNEHDMRLKMWKSGSRLVRNMMDCSKPVIAAINGPVAGGGLVVAMLADISVAAENAKIVEAHARLGVAAGDHAALIWPLLCGMAKAKYYLLLCDPLTGKEAERIGLVSLCVADNQVQDKSLELATRLAQSAPSAVRWTKHALNNWLRMAWPIFDAGMALEALGFSGPEAREGQAALVERRPPRFDLESPL